MKPRDDTWNEKEEEEDKTNNNKKPFKTVFFFSAALAGYLYPLLKLKENARVQQKRSVRSAATTCTQLRKLHETNFKEVLKFMPRRCKSFRQKKTLKKQLLPSVTILQATPSDFQKLKLPPMCEEGRGGRTGREEREREEEERRSNSSFQTLALRPPLFLPDGWMNRVEVDETRRHHQPPE